MGDPRSGRFKFMNQLPCLEIPNLDADVGTPPGCHQEVGRSQGFHSRDIFLTARVELAERIAFEIPDSDLAISSAHQQLATIR